MKTSLTAQDVLDDIEFELIQGAISRDDLGRGIQAVKKHQSEVRRETFDKKSKDISWQEVAAKQFQINDMLLTLLQEMAANNTELTRKFERFGKKRRTLRQLTAAEQVEYFEQQSRLVAEVEERPTNDVKQAMLFDALQVKIMVQPVRLPVIGGFVNRIKLALHNLTLFYLRLFAKKQTQVNQIYGDWILYLNSLHCLQQEEMDILRERVHRLEEHDLNTEVGGDGS